MNKSFIPRHQHFGAIAEEANKVQITIRTNQRVNLLYWGENAFSHSASGPEHRFSSCLFIFGPFYFPREGGVFRHPAPCLELDLFPFNPCVFHFWENSSFYLGEGGVF